ncbi:hypothetical protein [Providencia hangzhouensis]|uniref:hypothetical protein n=1 Tax=Providencia hangzhouensis TaxID=3031799 RepID=UPI0034DD5140
MNNRLLLYNLHDTQTLLSFEQRKQFGSHDYLACRDMSPGISKDNYHQTQHSEHGDDIGH